MKLTQRAGILHLSGPKGANFVNFPVDSSPLVQKEFQMLFFMSFFLKIEK